MALPPRPASGERRDHPGGSRRELVPSSAVGTPNLTLHRDWEYTAIIMDFGRYHGCSQGLPGRTCRRPSDEGSHGSSSVDLDRLGPEMVPKSCNGLLSERRILVPVPIIIQDGKLILGQDVGQRLRVYPPPDVGHASLQDRAGACRDGTLFIVARQLESTGHRQRWRVSGRGGGIAHHHGREAVRQQQL